jgi:hypothetical protein
MNTLFNFISISFFVLIFSPVYSQVAFDLQGGISNTSILSDKNQNANFRSDLNTYVSGSIRLEGEELIGILLDVIYEKKGANYIDAQYQSVFKLQYVSLSPMASFNLSENLSIFLGPYFSLRINEDHTVNGQQTNQDKSNYLSKSDDLGLRSSFRFQFDQLFFQMSYSFGLTDIRSNSFDASYNGPNFPEGLFNKSFSIGLGYIFEY